MISHLPILIVIIPLITAVVLPLLAFFSVRLLLPLTLTALAADALCATLALWHVLGQEPWHYRLGGWEAPWGIVYVIDPLAGTLTTLIAWMACLVVLYARAHLQDYAGLRTGVFYSLFTLLVTGLQGIVTTGDVFNLYVFLEIASLAAYGLLATGGLRATMATLRYLFVGTIAAVFYLLGVGYLYALTGTLNMADLARTIPTIVDSKAFVVAVAFLTTGLAIKTALFPLHGWLPDIYTYASGAVIGLVAAVMSKVSAYVLFRLLYFVLHTAGAAGHVLTLLGWAAVVAMIAGALLAIVQRDIRRMLAYSSIGQMGYIVLGLALGTPAALTGMVFHIIHHAMTKGCLFLAVSGIHWRMGHTSINDLAGLSRHMPLTMAAFAVAALSLMGLPPSAGFVSKWYLLTGALEAHHGVAVAGIVVSSLLSAVYVCRIFEVAYLRQELPHRHPGQQARELPLPMLAPIVILAAAVILLGLYNQAIVQHVIRFTLPPVKIMMRG